MKLKLKQQRVEEQKAANARERQIAKEYFNSGPSIQNLYNAFIHWYNSVPYLGGYDESGNDYITGVPPAAGIKNLEKVTKVAKVAGELNKAVSKGIKFGLKQKVLPVVRTIEKAHETPTASLKFFERPVKIDWSQKAGLPKEVRNRRVPEYTLNDARKEAKQFAEKWGYNLPENASLKLIEDLYNLHNTLFRGVTTEGLELAREDVAMALGINPSELTALQYLQYASTYPWTPQQRIWVTPYATYGRLYSAGEHALNGFAGQVSAVMRPWKTTKDIKQWPKQAEWNLGFKEDQDAIITPWVSRARNAIVDRAEQREMLARGPLIYRGLAKDFEGTNNTTLIYPEVEDGYFLIPWLDRVLPPLPKEINIGL